VKKSWAMNASRFLLLAATFAASLPVVACSAAPDGRTTTTQQPSTGACAATITDYCLKNSCLASWTSADDACMNADPGNPNVPHFSTACGGDSLYAFQKDGATMYYESSTSGLVAIVDASGSCVAGPSEFVAPAAASCPLIACSMQNCGGGPDGGFEGVMP
jgi:hypothetical protein